jgi:hypothetical protein
MSNKDFPTTAQDLSPAVAHACRAISAFLTKLEHAAEKIGQYKCSIGHHIATVKKERPDDWEDIVQAECGLKRRQAYNYLARVNGTKTVEEQRAANAAANKRLRDRQRARASRDAQNPPCSVVDEIETGRAIDLVDRALQDELAAAKIRIAKLEAENAALKTENAVLRAKLAEGPAEAEDTPTDLTTTTAAAGNGGDGLDVPQFLVDAAHRRWPKFVEEPRQASVVCERARVEIEPAHQPPPVTESPSDYDSWLAQVDAKIGDRPRTAPADGSLSAAVADAFNELEELACECREVVDNAPEGLSATQRIETLNETAEVLEGLFERTRRLGRARRDQSQSAQASQTALPWRSAGCCAQHHYCMHESARSHR